MPLKISRELLEQLVIEELAKHIYRLDEAPPGRSTVLDDEDPEQLPGEEEVPNPGNAPEEQLPTDSPIDGIEGGGEEEGGEDVEDGGDEDPADMDLDALLKGDEPPDEEEEGTVAGEIKDKTIEQITVDEDSKIMPGATEIIFVFRENPDAFRILVTKTGKVKYFYRGLHNSVTAPVAPMPADDAPEDEMDLLGGEEGEEGPGGDDLAAMAGMPSPDDEGGLPPPDDEEEQLP
jgi:hypothetical protein